MDAVSLTIIAALLGGPVAAGLVARFLPAKSSPLERLEKVEQNLESLQGDFRTLQDYTHQLRSDVVRLGGTPRPWPDGLTQ